MAFAVLVQSIRKRLIYTIVRDAFPIPIPLTPYGIELIGRAPSFINGASTPLPPLRLLLTRAILPVDVDGSMQQNANLLYDTNLP